MRSRLFAGMVMWLAVAPLSADARQGTPSEPSPTVGMPERIEQLVLPGTELEAKRREDRLAPLVLRVVEVYPHGDAFRYDLEFTGFEAGSHDLRNYLQRKDGSSMEGVPPIPVEVVAALPPGQILPHTPTTEGPPRLGGYTTLLGLGLVLWTCGLVVFGLRGRRRAIAARTGPKVVTLADRLRPLVQEAVDGRIEPGKLAELERLLIGYWTRRLDLRDLPPYEAVAQLRKHEEAGPLLEQLEAWLHRPSGGDRVDVPALLAPYRDVSADAIDVPKPTEPAPVEHVA